MPKRSKTSAIYRQLNLKDSWISSPAAFPANHFLLPVNDKGQLINDTSGPKCSGSSKSVSQDGLWRKMFLELLLHKGEWYSNRYVLTWKVVVTKFNRCLYQLQASVRRTYATGSGLSRTSAMPKGKVSQKEQLNRMPPVQDLGIIIAALNRHLTLPTPTARDWKGARSRAALQKAGRAATNSLPDYFSATTGLVLPLNPHFVELVMGFPPNWTASPFQDGGGIQSAPLETPSFPK